MSLLVYFGGCDEYSRRAAKDRDLFTWLYELRWLNSACNRCIETWVASRTTAIQWTDRNKNRARRKL